VKLKKLENILIIVLTVGTFVAFFAVYQDFLRFHDFEGVWFKFKDCTAVHPFLTPCFYGAFAFLGSLIWALIISTKKLGYQFKYLFWFLIGGVIFAWSNFGKELYKFYQASGQEYVGCSGAKVLNPFVTPCFYGSFLFLTALLVAFFINKKISIKK